MKHKKLTAVICLISLLFGFSVNSSANSAQTYWEGTDSVGAILTDGQSPIIVEGEVLIFDLKAITNENYTYENIYDCVSAEYSFYNPSDMTVTATLAFPYGKTNSYGEPQTEDQLKKYGVKINGEEIEAAVRHTYSPYYGFDLDTELDRLSDDCLTSGIYTPDTKVTIYKWSVSDLEEAQSTSVALDVDKNDKSRVYYLQSMNGIRDKGDDKIRISRFISNKTEAPAIYLYVIGEPLTDLPKWTFYSDGAVKDGEEVYGQTIYLGCESMTLYDLAMSNYDSQGEVSELDWYNALICTLSENGDSEHPAVDLYSFENQFRNSFLCWYQYEISLEPGGRIKNTVTAPLNPAVDLSYAPSLFTYTYLLSPASTWASFGSLEIIVNTDYYIIDSTVSGFEKTEGGYRLLREGLPKGDDGNYLDLTFSVSASENPEKSSDGIGLWILLSIVLLILSPFYYLIQGIEWVFEQIVSLF